VLDSGLSDSFRFCSGPFVFANHYTAVIAKLLTLYRLFRTFLRHSQLQAVVIRLQRYAVTFRALTGRGWEVAALAQLAAQQGGSRFTWHFLWQFTQHLGVVGRSTNRSSCGPILPGQSNSRTAAVTIGRFLSVAVLFS
jgi:hypothetical protein